LQIGLYITSILSHFTNIFAARGHDFADRTPDVNRTYRDLPMIIRQSVLCIEDDIASLQLIERLLSLYPYQVLKATTAEDGLAIAQEYIPQAILLDLDLPGMDGLSALRLFKQHPYLRFIPVIIITSHDTLQQESLKAGASDFILKPVSFDMLQTTLQNALKIRTGA
jgi:two-component system cell cycle response regulator DivK